MAPPRAPPVVRPRAVRAAIIPAPPSAGACPPELLAAQLYAESDFNPFARSPAGAQGIAQFMPGTAAAMGLARPVRRRRAINAQAHLMRDLLGRFGSVPLALAAYNAGPGAVGPADASLPIPETPAYVAASSAFWAARATSPPARSRFASCSERSRRSVEPVDPGGRRVGV